MKLLLHVDVDGVGYVGEVVEVACGYARNYLLPQKLAVEPTPDNIKAIEKERASQSKIRQLAREALEKAAEKVNGASVILKVLANEQGHLFGSVSKEDIAKSLREQGFEVQDKQVMSREHIRQLGSYEVKLRYAQDIESEVQVELIRPEEQDDVSGTEAESNDE